MCGHATVPPISVMNSRRLIGPQEILAGRDYFFDHFTAVDAHFFWCFRRGLQFELDVSKFANCVKHHERMKSRSSVQKLLAHEKAVQAEFAKAA
jgi:glutathione S-transferase